MSSLAVSPAASLVASHVLPAYPNWYWPWTWWSFDVPVSMCFADCRPLCHRPNCSLHAHRSTRSDISQSNSISPCETRYCPRCSSPNCDAPWSDWYRRSWLDSGSSTVALNSSSSAPDDWRWDGDCRETRNYRPVRSCEIVCVWLVWASCAWFCPGNFDWTSWAIATHCRSVWRETFAFRTASSQSKLKTLLLRMRFLMEVFFIWVYWSFVVYPTLSSVNA